MVILTKVGRGKLLCMLMLLLIFSPAIASSIHAKAQLDHDNAIQLGREAQYDKALNLLTPYIQSPSRFPSMAIDYIVILNWARRHQDAVTAWESLPVQISRPDYLKIAVADSLLKIKKYQESYDIYGSILQKSPQYNKAKQGQVRVLIGMSKYQDALVFFKKNNLKDRALYIPLQFATENYKKGFELYKRTFLNGSKRGIDDQIKQNFAVMSGDQKNKITDILKANAGSGKSQDIINYLLYLHLIDHPTDDIQLVSMQGVIHGYTDEQLSIAGWIVYRSNQFVAAKQLFFGAIRKNKKHFRARLGLLYVYIQNKNFKEADNILRKLQQGYAGNTELLYAEAFFHERQSEFWYAVQTYDQILAGHPDDLVARKLQIKDISNLGATTQAKAEAHQYLETNLILSDALQEDHVINQMRWNEPWEALKKIEPLLKKQVLRSRFDYGPLLVNTDQASKAVYAYEELINEGLIPPLWLQNIAAGAYMTVEKREMALKIYNHVLETQPRSFASRLGKFYALSELQRWEEADKVLNSLEKDIPWKFGNYPNEQINPQRVSVAMARGSWLAEQQRLPEADAHFTRLHAAAPGNLDFREGLSNIHKRRGWKRKARQDFQIIASMQSRDRLPPLELGLTEVLYSLQQKDQAKKRLALASTRRPRNPQVKRLQRDFTVQEMHVLTTGFRYENSQDGALDKSIYMRYKHPLSLYTNLTFSETIRRSKQGALSAKFDRFGIGLDHTFNSDWYAYTELSSDHGRGGDFGALLGVNWTPDDYWSLNAFYNSYVANVDVRSRVFGITSDQVGGRINYRWSDWREAGVSVATSGYSDGNRRIETGAYYGQNIWAFHDWRIHIQGDVYTAFNSLSGRPYFNPRQSGSLTGTLMLEDNFWHRYESLSKKFNRSFTHRLYLTGGSYWQSNFNQGAILGIRYEQDIVFSDVHRFKWGINWGRRPYDGIGVGSYSIDGEYQWKF